MAATQLDSEMKMSYLCCCFFCAYEVPWRLSHLSFVPHGIQPQGSMAKIIEINTFNCVDLLSHDSVSVISPAVGTALGLLGGTVDASLGASTASTSPPYLSGLSPSEPSLNTYLALRTMDSLSAWLESLPPAADFLPPPSPEAYTVLLSVFQYFPVVSCTRPLKPSKRRQLEAIAVINDPICFSSH